MSASPKMRMAMHDLEKGRAAPMQPSTFSFPQRRRKMIIVMLFLAALGLFVYASEQSDSALSLGSWKWVKDSMRPVSSQSQDGTPSTASIHTHTGSETFGNEPFQPTAALVSFAEQMHTPLPTSTPHDPSKELEPSHVDQVLLLLTAMKDGSYHVPQLEAQRVAELQPSTTADFVKTLAKIKADPVDQDLYAKSQSSWRQKHRSQSPLTVFSKSYCPYSKRAKALLTTMGVQYDVYEVDLREDAHSLQLGLKEVTKHATFPTIFVKDELIGGYDDLARLQRIGVLKGILEGAGATFTPSAAPAT